VSKWEVYRDASGRLYVAGDTTGPIAWVNEDDVAQDGMSNADLIAAAPELLRELEHLARCIGPWIEAGHGIPGIATLNGARAAIFKAKGQ
jgi:hypothetical protein